MAYTEEEFQVIVSGTIGDHEVWSNTWTVLDVAETNPRTDAVAAVRTFYQGILGSLSGDWAANAAIVRELESGLGVPASWEVMVGTSGVELMPTQLAVRVSLDDQAGHRGGPFLAGFTAAANNAAGELEEASRAAILGSIDQLASDLVADGFMLRIDRPTVLTTVPAARARVGTRFDVIRRRANDVPESYLFANLL